ncbi:MAG TPA: chemotaxis protein CheW [Microvirga sp.]|nr:chemotaxis protein CheW [Microvirga sp.]
MRGSLRHRLRQIGKARHLSSEERARLLLDERTERLAARSQRETETNRIRVLLCSVGSELYGVSLDVVAEVLPFQPLVPVPDGPAALLGLFGHGGHLVSAIDLGQALGHAPAPQNGESRHLVLLRREQPRAALCVDRALGVEDVTPLAADETRAFRTEAVVGYAKAEPIADQERVLSLLGIDRLLQQFLPSSPVPGV